MTGIFGKPGWLLVLLAAAFAVPYTLSNKQFQATVAKAMGGSDPVASREGASNQGGVAAQPDSVVAPIPLPPQSPLCDMASAFRFDVTPQWVAGTWPRVNTVVVDTKYSGLRVPLVTGVMPDDLVGTLTYYFDSERQLQRITFAGHSADPRRLVSLITSQYRLTPQSTLEAGLYQSKWNGKVISNLEVRQAPVAAAGARANFDIQLDLNRADALAGATRVPRRLFGW